jgi:heat-inducible transcriptional repressor
MIPELNQRSRDIFRYIVDSYLAGGDPVGSKTIAQHLGQHQSMSISPATIRNVMADLEEAGLLYAPHTSAGRMPTQQGLRFYVDGLMQVGHLSADERQYIETSCTPSGRSVNQILEQASTMISGLSGSAGIVIAPKTDKPIRQIQFVRLKDTQALVVLVMQDGLVENRVMDIDRDITSSALVMAANYLNDRLAGRTLNDARLLIEREIAENRAQLDSITTRLVRDGIALPTDKNNGVIIVRGQSKLLDDVRAVEDLENARTLLSALEEQETMMRLLSATHGAQGIQIYIGTENQMFSHSGWSMVISPYRSEDRIIGAIGVIGPTRLNYGRVIPIVDYTSRVVERLLG